MIQSAYHTVLGCYCKMTVPMQILICVSWLPVDSGVKSAIFIWGYQHIKKRYGAIFFGIFICEMDVSINGIDMSKEGIFLCSLDDGETIIHKPLPDFRGNGAVARALVSRSSINKLATIGLMGEPIAVPLTCSYIFPWNVK